jgi:hypothetical protein
LAPARSTYSSPSTLRRIAMPLSYIALSMVSSLMAE